MSCGFCSRIKRMVIQSAFPRMSPISGLVWMWQSGSESVCALRSGAESLQFFRTRGRLLCSNEFWHSVYIIWKTELHPLAQTADFSGRDDGNLHRPQSSAKVLLRWPWLSMKVPTINLEDPYWVKKPCPDLSIHPGFCQVQSLDNAMPHPN